MNTNSNTYTVIYTSLVVVVVAALLAFVSQTLKASQNANEKAETIGQILSAAQFDLSQVNGNAATIAFFKENIQSAQLVNKAGEVVGTLDLESAEVLSTSDLKKQNYEIAKAEGDVKLPVYTFSNGISVVAIYGQGLWGPVWGNIAFQNGTTDIVGAYFDHASETPGLGGKIKDDPSFRAQFIGKSVNYAAEQPFEIVKGGAPAGQSNAIDAITGATMTSKYLNTSINNWLKAYQSFLSAGETCCAEGECCCEGEHEGECCNETKTEEE